MNPTERLFSVLDGKQPDAMPWFADLALWVHARTEEETLPEPYQGDGIVDLYRDYGCGAFIETGHAPWSVDYGDDVVISQSFGNKTWQPGPRSWENWYEDEIAINKELRSAKEKLQYLVEWKTPLGAITQVKQYLPQSFCWAYRKHPVNNREDLKVLRFIKEHERVSPDYRPQEEMIALWGDVGVASSLAPRTPLADLLFQWMGVTETLYALYDIPGEMDSLMDIMNEVADPVYEIIARSPAPMVAIVDQIHNDIISPRLFSRYFAPFYRRHLPALHANGKRVMLHVDGNFRKVLRLIGETGIDIAEALTVDPVGDAAISELRELAGPEMILWGGLPGALFSRLYPEEQLRECVMECIRVHKAYGRFVFGVADEVPPDGDLERVRMVTDLIDEYGRYQGRREEKYG